MEQDLLSMMCADGLALARSTLTLLTGWHSKAKRLYVGKECNTFATDLALQRPDIQVSGGQVLCFSYILTYTPIPRFKGGIRAWVRAHMSCHLREFMGVGVCTRVSRFPVSVDESIGFPIYLVAKSCLWVGRGQGLGLSYCS